MRRILLILMGLGRFKAYWIEESPRFKLPRLELLEEWETVVGQRFSDPFRDKRGQFAKGALSFKAINDMADGERHNVELELRRRALKQMATRVGELLTPDSVEQCYLAADPTISRKVQRRLSDAVRQKIITNLSVNLTRVKRCDIVRHLPSPA